jgi:hypothetical protein
MEMRFAVLGHLFFGAHWPSLPFPRSGFLPIAIGFLRRIPGLNTIFYIPAVNKVRVQRGSSDRPVPRSIFAFCPHCPIFILPGCGQVSRREQIARVTAASCVQSPLSILSLFEDNSNFKRCHFRPASLQHAPRPRRLKRRRQLHPLLCRLRANARPPPYLPRLAPAAAPRRRSAIPAR